MKSPRILLALLTLTVLAWCGPGCSTLTPRTADLNALHEAYRDDFAQFVLPARTLGGIGQRAVGSNAPTFVRGLQAIHDYRLKYPADSLENDHLTVLEGMVYVQSGRLGLARLMADDVKTAGNRLVSARGTLTRDALFASNFDALVSGWAEIYKVGQVPARWETLQAAAESVHQNLETIDPRKLPSPESDSGALYLATTAASFTAWACNLRSIHDPAGARAHCLQWLDRAETLLGRFLTDREKTEEAAAGLEGRETGRLRAVLWYDWLRKNKTRFASL